jgi:hypothetical protein
VALCLSIGPDASRLVSAGRAPSPALLYAAMRRVESTEYVGVPRGVAIYYSHKRAGMAPSVPAGGVWVCDRRARVGE